MVHSGFSNDEINRMKSDAIKRAKEMNSRADYKKCSSKKQNENLPKSNFQNLFGIADAFGISKDQLILIAIILLISDNKNNLPLMLALLYIAM